MLKFKRAVSSVALRNSIVITSGKIGSEDISETDHASKDRIKHVRIHLIIGVSNINYYGEIKPLIVEDVAAVGGGSIARTCGQDPLRRLDEEEA